MPITKQKDQQPEAISARDVFAIIFKHKYKILITFLAVLAGAVAWTFQMHQVYEAKSVLLVKFGGREYLLRPEETSKPGIETSVPGYLHN